MAIHKFMQDQINYVFDDCKKIKIYKNDKIIKFERDSKEFGKIMDIWQMTLKNSYEMPSLGVSLDDETKTAIKKGLFIEFIFDKTYSHNEMPFDTLLVEIVENQGGYQLHRNYDNQYQGRCYYLNIFEINNDLYDYINNIEKN